MIGGADIDGTLFKYDHMKVSEILANSTKAYPSLEIVPPLRGMTKDELLESTRALDTVLCEKGIPAYMDYWGFDVDHDWCWWRVQLPYFMEKIVPKK